LVFHGPGYCLSPLLGAPLLASFFREALKLIYVPVLRIAKEFKLESGGRLAALDIAYETYGQLNAAGDNVIWICHALTGDHRPHEWWDGLVGTAKLLDPDRYFIICANMLGSCYGTTGPNSINPDTEQPYGKHFPLVTTRDMVRAHRLLADHLRIARIQLIIGGSMGGQQTLEWAIEEPQRFDRVCVLATNAQHSAWGIAFNEAQRMAIEADQERHAETDGGFRGLEAARAIAMLSYRNYETYQSTQIDAEEKLDNFRASSYQRYQGNKLRKRFAVQSYVTLSKAMDAHNVGRGRGGLVAALQHIQAPTLVVGVKSDMLFPPAEQVFLAEHIPEANFRLIDSPYGHDGFLVEYEQMQRYLGSFLEGRLYQNRPKQTPRSTNYDRLQGRGPYLPGTESF